MANYNAITKAVAEVVFDAKKQVLKDFGAFLSEKIDFDDDMKGYFDEFEKTLVKDVPPKHKGKTNSGDSSDSSGEKKKRPPSAYNNFISEKMGEIKKKNPEMKGKELMKAAIEAWNEQKSNAAAPEIANQESSDEDEKKTKGKKK